MLVVGLALSAPAGAAKGPTPRCSITDPAVPDTTYTTLQAAVDAAAEGATLEVRGYCLGNTSIPPKSLTITGVEDDAFKQGPILDGGGQGHVLSIGGSLSRTTISNLTIQHGAALRGGGISVATTQLDLFDTTVRENSAVQGGGISSSQAVLTLHDSTVKDNSTVPGEFAERGAGIHITSGLYGSYTTLLGSTVSRNRTAGAGGGIYAVAFSRRTTSINVQYGSTIANNEALYGGGLYSEGVAATYPGWVMAQFLGGTIRGNHATIGAGVYNANAHTGLYLNDWDDTPSQIRDNRALTYGGGIYNAAGAYNGNCVEGVTVFNNTPDDIYTEIPPP